MFHLTLHCPNAQLLALVAPPLPPSLGHSDIIRSSSEHTAPPLPVLAVLNCPRGSPLFPSLSSDHRSNGGSGASRVLCRWRREAYIVHLQTQSLPSVTTFFFPFSSRPPRLREIRNRVVWKGAGVMESSPTLGTPLNANHFFKERVRIR